MDSMDVVPYSRYIKNASPELYDLLMAIEDEEVQDRFIEAAIDALKAGKFKTPDFIDYYP